jgi:hypothetical protein
MPGLPRHPDVSGRTGAGWRAAGRPGLTIGARNAKILEALHCAEEKHVWHVRIFHVLQRFRVKAAGASVAASANLAYGAVRAAAEPLSLTVLCAW